MDHGKLSYPEVPSDPEPRIPDPYSLTLSDEEAAEFRKLMKEECGVEMTLDAARYRGLELLRLSLLLLDPDSLRDLPDSGMADGEGEVAGAARPGLAVAAEFASNCSWLARD